MKSKARSPTEKNPSESRSVIDVVFFALQCSQRIGQWLTLLSIVHIISTQVAVMVCPVLSDTIGGILEMCIPYYKLGVSAYFGKAAIENVLKIAKDVKSINAYTKSVSLNDDNG